MGENPKLKVALIYSFGANEDTEEGILTEENSEDTSNLDESSRDFLDLAIDDYNENVIFSKKGLFEKKIFFWRKRTMKQYLDEMIK